MSTLFGQYSTEKGNRAKFVKKYCISMCHEIYEAAQKMCYLFNYLKLSNDQAKLEQFEKNFVQGVQFALFSQADMNQHDERLKKDMARMICPQGQKMARKLYLANESFVKQVLA